jgi:hypothetical protein
LQQGALPAGKQQRRRGGGFCQCLRVIVIQQAEQAAVSCSAQAMAASRASASARLSRSASATSCPTNGAVCAVLAASTWLAEPKAAISLRKPAGPMPGVRASSSQSSFCWLIRFRRVDHIPDAGASVLSSTRP